MKSRKCEKNDRYMDLVCERFPQRNPTKKLFNRLLQNKIKQTVTYQSEE